MLGLGPRDRRCKSCHADHFRNGLVDKWIIGLMPESFPINLLIHQSLIQLPAAAVAEIDEVFVF